VTDARIRRRLVRECEPLRMKKGSTFRQEAVSFSCLRFRPAPPTPTHIAAQPEDRCEKPALLEHTCRECRRVSSLHSIPLISAPLSIPSQPSADSISPCGCFPSCPRTMPSTRSLTVGRGRDKGTSITFAIVCPCAGPDPAS